MRDFSQNPIDSEEALIAFVEQEKKRLSVKKNFPRLGNFAKIMYSLEIEDHEFWTLFGKLIEKNYFVFDFNQIADCLEVFDFYERVLSKRLKPVRTSFFDSQLLLSDKKEEQRALIDPDFYLEDLDNFSKFIFL